MAGKMSERNDIAIPAIAFRIESRVGGRFGPLGRLAVRSYRFASALVVLAMLLLAGNSAFGLETEAPQTDIAPPSEEVHGSTDKANSQPSLDERGQEALCLIIESAARSNNLPLEFFVRVIWQESRFQPNAVGPVTRNGQRAQGIAQFMPGTASERRLLDPFDPVQALPKSAEFLNDLRNQFGNLGLAAAAYNAGPRRVQDWLAGSGVMPQETRNYVLAITGSSADDWALAARNGKPPDSPSQASCRRLLASLQSSPNTFASALEHRVRRAVAKMWGVQIAAGFNRDNALEMYARAIKSLSTTIGEGREPLLVRSPGTSTFYHVLIGTDTRRESDDLCSKIRRAGGSCLVKRNQEGPRIAARGHLVSRVHAARRRLVRP
jgi:Transglycosylase SLT domain/SPOR domain